MLFLLAIFAHSARAAPQIAPGARFFKLFFHCRHNGTVRQDKCGDADMHLYRYFFHNIHSRPADDKRPALPYTGPAALRAQERLPLIKISCHKGVFP